MLRVDPEKVEAQLTAMVAALAPHLDGSEANNVLARMQTLVVPAIIRWKLGEMARGVGENDLLNALVCLVSSQMAGIIGEVVGSADFGKEHFALANNLLQPIGEEIGAIMTGEREMQQFSVGAESVN